MELLLLVTALALDVGLLLPAAIPGLGRGVAPLGRRPWPPMRGSSRPVIQVYAPSSNAEEAEVEQFYEDLQDLLELTPKKDVSLITGDWTAKVGSQETSGVTDNLALE